MAGDWESSLSRMIPACHSRMEQQANTRFTIGPIRGRSASIRQLPLA